MFIFNFRVLNVIKMFYFFEFKAVFAGNIRPSERLQKEVSIEMGRSSGLWTWKEGGQSRGCTPLY